MLDAFTLVDGKPTITKDPEAVLDYTVDFSAWLNPGETLYTSAVTGKGVAIQSSGIVGGTAVTLWVSGGKAGTTASARVRITTNSSPARVDDRTVYFLVRGR